MAYIETSATLAGPATSDIPVIDVWIILIDNENTPLGRPLCLYDVMNFNVDQLLVEILNGPYQAKLKDINILDLEVWECPTLSLEGHGPNDIEGLVKPLMLSRVGDSNREVAVWEPVAGLQLSKYQPLVIRVTSKSE